MCSKYCPWISLFSSFHCTLNIIILFVSVTRQSFETTVMLLFIKHQVSYLLLFVSKHESELFLTKTTEWPSNFDFVSVCILLFLGE